MIIWRCTLTESGTWGQVDFDDTAMTATITSESGESATLRGREALQLLAVFTSATERIHRHLNAKEQS